MSTKRNLKFSPSVALVGLFVVLLMGCAAKKTVFWGEVKKGLILRSSIKHRTFSDNTVFKMTMDT